MGSLGIKGGNFNSSLSTTTTIQFNNMPTAAELCQQIADMARILEETKQVEKEEVRKAAEAEAAKKAVEADAKKKADEAEAKRKADEEKAKKIKKAAQKGADDAQKAKVHALAVTKKGKEVEKTPEVEVETET
jgi:hypothetical protein